MRLERELDDLAAEIDFAGVVRVDDPGHETLAKAYGLAHRGYAIPNTVDTRLALASMTKGFTALAVVSLIEQGTIELGTTARSLLGTDLPLIAEDVTVEQLLAHRSGIGDYLDEELHPDVAEYVMTGAGARAGDAPRTTSPSWTAIRRRSRPARGSPTTTVPTSCSPSSPSERAACRITISWSSASSVERACSTRTSRGPTSSPALWHRATSTLTGAFAATCCTCRCAASGTAVRTRPSQTCTRSGPGSFAGDIVALEWVAEMVRPRSDAPEQGRRYGLGFWLHPSSDVVFLEGADAGISCRSVHDPATGVTYTVISNSSDGAWPILELLADRLGTAAEGRAVDEAGASA